MIQLLIWLLIALGGGVAEEAHSPPRAVIIDECIPSDTTDCTTPPSELPGPPHR